MNRTLPIFALALSALIALSFSSSSVRAEEDEYAPATEAHRDGRWSLQFEILDNFNLGSFEGSAISATKNTSPTGAWRFGVDYLGLVNSTSAANSSTDTLFVPPPGNEQKSSRGLLGVSALRLHRVNPGQRIGVFLGAGPFVRWSHDHHRSTEDPGPAGQFEQEQNNTALFAGLSGALGAEVFVARSISLHAQYGAQFGYQSTEQNFTNRQTTAPPASIVTESQVTLKSHTWLLSSNSVRFGVSVYL